MPEITLIYYNELPWSPNELPCSPSKPFHCSHADITDISGHLCKGCRTSCDAILKHVNLTETESLREP